MRCGTKCFHVQYEIDGEKQNKEVIARSSVEARKNFRTKHGREIEIISVRERKKNDN